ncbi:MAG: hypothetical protein AB7T07_13055 [Steroidobacteraceae bacterium]
MSDKPFDRSKTAAVLTMLAAWLATMPGTLSAAPYSESPVRFVVTTGITTGGDTIEKIEYNHGGSATIKGGGLVQIGGGVQYHRPYSAFSALATLNYHIDSATARNGDAYFDRVPLELLGFYHLNEWWRIGGGLRYTMNPTFTEKFDYEDRITIDYKNATSLVLQVGFGTERFWGALRYVNESFDAERLTVGRFSAPYHHTDDGSHVGLFGYFLF